MNSKKQHLKELRKIGYRYKTLQPLEIAEAKMHRWSEAVCNGECSESEYEKICEEVLSAVSKAFGGDLPDNFFINGDPRGYCLKINQGNTRTPLTLQDMGGYGILAPEFEGVK